MHQSLDVEERNHLDRLVAAAEKRCGAQIILAIIGRSDDYPELPWRAFALSASMATLAANGNFHTKLYMKKNRTRGARRVFSLPERE